MKVKTTQTGRRQFTTVIELTTDEIQALRDSDLAEELGGPAGTLVCRAITNAIEFQLTEDIEGQVVGR